MPVRALCCGKQFDQSDPAKVYKSESFHKVCAYWYTCKLCLSTLVYTLALILAFTISYPWSVSSVRSIGRRITIMPLKVFVIVDSRCLFLENTLIRLNNDPRCVYRVIVKKRRGLSKLWAIAKPLLLINEADIVYLYGGICDVSRIYHVGSCQFWINGSVEEKVTILPHAMATIYLDALSSHLRG